MDGIHRLDKFIKVAFQRIERVVWQVEYCILQYALWGFR